jgi:hypothetical protein
MKNVLVSACLVLFAAVFAPLGFGQIVTCAVDPEKIEGGCTDVTFNKPCDSADPTKVCTNTRPPSGTKQGCECKAPVTPGKKGGDKTGGSFTQQLLDRAAMAQLTAVRRAALNREPVTITIPFRFTQQPEVNQTVAFLPNGDVLRERTALKGGTATLRLSTTADTELLDLSVEGLTLEAAGFSFTAIQPRVTGTLSMQTGRFEATVSFGAFETPETRTPFRWKGAAHGRYDFDTGQLDIIESGVGFYLSEETLPVARSMQR